MSNSVLIVDEMHPSIEPLLHEIGVKADYRPKITREETLGIIANYEGIIVRSKLTFDKTLIDQATQLQFIARAGSGLDIIDVEYALSKNIEVFNAPEGNRDAVAEHTLGLILGILHKINKSDKEVRQLLWNREDNRGIELKHKTVAVIGYGNVGREVVKRLQCFGCKVLIYDKYKTGFSNNQPPTREASLEEIFEKSDIISYHIPLTPETKGLVDKDYLANFQKPIVLINTARGELVNLNDLCHALQDGKVTGAGLDVLENEKLATLTTSQKANLEYLAAHPQVILTPHVAGWTKESYIRINEVLVKKIYQVLHK